MLSGLIKSTRSISSSRFLPRTALAVQQVLVQQTHKILGTSRFVIFVVYLFLGTIVVGLSTPTFKGDAAEYTLLTIAIASHVSSDICPADILLAQSLFPEFSWFHTSIVKHWSEGARLPPGFLNGTDKQVYAIHYFGYSAIAALPFRILQTIGLNPTRCFLWVDWTCLVILLLAARAYFGSIGRSAAATGIFLMGVGIPYWNWASPEFFTATLSLSALLLMAASSVMRSAALVGMAAMQNPPVLVLLGMGPLVVIAERVVTLGPSSVPLAMSRDRLWSLALGGLLGAAIALMPIYFSLQHFGSWNIIASGATDPRLVTLHRLVSYYLDLNQGMIVAIPGVVLLAAYLLMRGRRQLILLAPTAVCSIMLAAPALGTQNWNAGSAGMMRYIAWGAAPVFYLLYACLRQQKNWSSGALLLFLVLQYACLKHSERYTHTSFSPTARWFLHHAPQFYHPEPEIFVDRLSQAEPMLDYDAVYSVQFGPTPKTLYYAGSAKSLAKLCPGGGRPSAASTAKASYDGWTYLNGTIKCDDTHLYIDTIDVFRFQGREDALLQDGWSRFEIASPSEGGVWSLGKTSRFLVRTSSAEVEAMTIRGIYRDGNTATKVIVNGTVLGWWHLDRPNRIPLAGVDVSKSLHIQLHHQAPAAPSEQDTRKLALFMNEVSISYRLNAQGVHARSLK